MLPCCVLPCCVCAERGGACGAWGGGGGVWGDEAGPGAVHAGDRRPRTGARYVDPYIMKLHVVREEAAFGPCREGP